MSKREIELFIFDIFVTIVKREETISHFNNPNDLRHHYFSWNSVIREFEIIGETNKYLINDSVNGFVEASNYFYTKGKQ